MELTGTTNYPLSCPDPIWDEFKTSFATADVNVNEALVATLAREIVWTRGDELDDDQLADYLELICEYDTRRE
ncbi:hypothetical protein ACFQO4_20670 [Saliphagus sp. GCM10025334]